MDPSYVEANREISQLPRERRKPDL